MATEADVTVTDDIVVAESESSAAGSGDGGSEYLGEEDLYYNAVTGEREREREGEQHPPPLVIP